MLDGAQVSLVAEVASRYFENHRAPDPPRFDLVGFLLCGSGLDPVLLDDLVELASVKPHAAAFRTIVDLDTLTLAHHQIDLARGALHHSLHH